MIVSIFALLVFYYLSKYISNKIIEIKTDNKKENDTNFWMFTYDFKEKKRDSIFDRESENIIKEKNKKNKLIVILYFVTVLIFIYAMYFFTKLIFLILN